MGGSLSGPYLVGVPRVPPVVLVLIGIASVQVGSSVAKQLFTLAPPVAAAWLRLAAAAVLLTLIARPRLRGRTWADWGPVIAYGVAMACMNFTFYLAIARIPIGMAVTFEFLGPLGVAVASSRRARDYVWVALAGLGVVLLGFTPGQLDWIGVLFALVAGAFWAAYIVLAGPVGRRWSGVTGVTIATWVGGVLLAAPALATASGMVTPWVSVPSAWLFGLLLALLSSVVPYGLEMVALRRIDRGVFGILMSLEPAAAALFAFLLLHEQLRPIELAAMACVIVASVGATRSARTP